MELDQKLIEWVEGLKNLASEEIPPFVQEVARYGFISNCVYAAAFFALLIAGIVLLVISVRRYEDMNAWFIGNLCAAAMCLIGFIAGVDSIANAVKARIAPKWFVLENLLKKG
jgi:hypothetical protein